MDIERPEFAKRKKRRQRIIVVLGGLAFAGAVGGLFLYEPGPYQVNEANVLVSEVERGPLVRQVRGIGTLVPADVRWVAARSSGRIERFKALLDFSKRQLRVDRDAGSHVHRRQANYASEKAVGYVDSDAFSRQCRELFRFSEHRLDIPIAPSLANFVRDRWASRIDGVYYGPYFTAGYHR